MEKRKGDAENPKMKIEAYGKDFAYLRKLPKHSDKLCIYGAGVNGEVICEYLREQGVDIEFFVDKQAGAREFFVLGKKVISPAVFFENVHNYKVIVSPDNQKPIINYLRENGVSDKHIISPFKKVEQDICLLPNGYNPQVYCDCHDQIGQTIGKSANVTIYTIMYNTPRELLCRTIESVLNQTVRDFEYLVIDNGSTDGSAEIVRLYAEKDKRIKYVRLKSNVVWASTEMLQTLRENINTEYVAMIDSDDYYMPTFLETVLRVAQSEGAEIVQVNTLTYAHEGFRYSYFTHYFGEDIAIDGVKKEHALLMRFLFVPVWGKLYSSLLFKKLIDMMLSYESEGERDRNFCLDISWTTYMALECRKAFLCDEILHIRTWRPGSSEHSDDHSAKWLSSIIWSFNHLRDKGIGYEKSGVFEEAPLMWLFSLQREEFGLERFRKTDLEYKRVKDFLERPVCDKFRGNRV